MTGPRHAPGRRDAFKQRLKKRLYRGLKRPPFERALVAAHDLTRDRPALQRKLVYLTPQPEDFAEDETREVRRRGFELRLRPRNYFQWHHYFGRLDPVLDTLVRLTAPGAVVADVGANIGIYALHVARAAGPAGRVLAFEPNPVTVETLSLHGRMNQMDNLEVVPVALGAEASDAASLVDAGAGDLGKFSLRARANAAEPADVTVPVRRLDASLDELGVRRLDVLKIDVEGFEVECLDGARSTIERDWPHVVIEVSPSWYGDRLPAMADHLLRLAKGPYRWFHLEEQRPRELDITAYARGLTPDSPQRNILGERR